MGWSYVPGLELSESEPPELSPGTELSLLLRTKPLQWPFSSRVSKTAPYLRSLSGTISRPSMAARGVESWISLLRGSRARISLWPATEQASTASDLPCSSKLPESFATFDLSTFSWRTWRPSLWDEPWMPFSGRWPKSGSTRNTDAFERPTLARHIAEIAGGASRGTDIGWPTMRVSADRSSRSSMTVDGHWAAPSLGQMAELAMGMLPREFKDETELTPQARRVYESGQRLWPTATGEDAESSARTTTRGKTPTTSEGGTLTDAVRLWATASASVANDGEGPETWRARQTLHKARGINGNGMGVPLTIQAQEATARLWATARSSDYKSGQVSDEVWEKNSRPLTEQAVRFSESLSGRLCPTTPTDGDLSWLATLASLPLSLNCLFVEWLMWGREGIGLTCLGHPATATDLIVSEDSAIPSAPRRQKRPSASSGTAHSESTRDPAPPSPDGREVRS